MYNHVQCVLIILYSRGQGTGITHKCCVWIGADTKTVQIAICTDSLCDYSVEEKTQYAEAYNCVEASSAFL